MSDDRRTQVWGEPTKPVPSGPHPILKGAIGVLALLITIALIQTASRWWSGGCSSENVSGVAGLGHYLADCDKTSSWFVESASVSGDTLLIVVNSGWYGFTTEQKASFVTELFPAVYILTREGDGYANPGSVTVRISDWDGDGKEVGWYSGDSGRYAVYR